MIDWTTKRVVVTGGAGFLGGFVVDKLKTRGCKEIFVPRRVNYDLTSEQAVVRMYENYRPDVVVHLAAEVGGIGANQHHPGRFFYKNMAMGLHLIEHARIQRIEKFVQVGTVCAYPKVTKVPFREEDLWEGYPEETNAPYGIAKKALFVMLDAYYREYGLKSALVVPVNLYGPGDNFSPESSHVIPALIKKYMDALVAGADKVTCWGTGNASREFLYVEDAAEGVLRAAEEMDVSTPINLGTGKEVSIKDLARVIAQLVGFKGETVWDTTKPDGQLRRCLDTQRAKHLLGWKAETTLLEGLQNTVSWYKGRLQPT